MKPSIFCGVLFLLGLSAVSVSLFAIELDEGIWNGNQIIFEKSVVIVGIPDSSSSGSLDLILDAFNATIEDSIFDWGIWKLVIPDSLDVVGVCDSINHNFNVDYAEPNLVGEAQTDDPNFVDQWNLNNTGQHEGLPGADIDVENAWALSTGAGEVRIGIIDSGISTDGGTPEVLNHPDLGGLPGGDPDRIEFGEIWVPGIDLFSDITGHGTNVAGVAGAETGNGLYVAGVCPDCHLYIEKASDMNFFDQYAYVAALRHASDHGVDVANASCAFLQTTLSMERAISHVGAQGMMVIAPTGNLNCNWISSPCVLSESAEYQNVICVGGTDRNDERWVNPGGLEDSIGSQFGEEINVAAPGGSSDLYGVLTTIVPSYGVYVGYVHGTSFAAPHVAGTVGLILSMNPDLSPENVKSIIEGSAEDVNGDEPGLEGWDEYLGYGRLNAFGALLLTPTDGPKTLQADVNMGAGRTYGIVGNLVVPDGITMKIDEGVHITMHQGSQITVEEGGVIVVQGTGDDPVVFQSETEESGYWNGIKIYSTEQDNEITHCEVSGATIGIRLVGGKCHLSGCDLKHNSCGLAIVNNGGALVEYTEIDSNVAFGCLVANNSHCTFDECDIYENGQSGIWCASYGTADLDFTNVHDNGNGEDYWQTGIRVIHGAADLYCSDVVENDGSGIASVGSLLELAFEYVESTNRSGGNEIVNNHPSVMGADPGEVFIDMAHLLQLREAHNSIIDDDVNHDLVVAWQASSVRVDWQQNYWGSTEVGEILNRLPQNVDIEPIDTSPTECSPDSPPKENPEDPAELQFYVAWQLENLTQFANAIEEYQELIDTWPGSQYAKIAVDRIVFCKGQLNSSWQETRDYFLALADTTSDKELELTARNAAAWCLVEMGEYEVAQDEFVALLDTTLSTSDSIKVAIDMLMGMLEADELDTILAVPIPGFGRSLSTPSALAASDMGFRTIMLADEVLKSFDLVSITSSAKSTLTPADFSVDQNYPNPFNSSTTIRYTIPEANEVRIQVYDVLGRRVVALVNESQTAGWHQVSWDSKSARGIDVSSGIYFYRIEAGRHLQTKKMLLLR